MSRRRHHRYLLGRLRSTARPGRGPRVVVLGAGFGGLAVAVNLKRAGITDLTIVEAGDGVGGTWRHNTYPGAACDVMSHLYSLSFAPNPEWSRTFATQPEILAYLEHVADDFDLRRHLRLGTRVDHARWDEVESVWELHTVADETIVADVLVSAVGLFAEPTVPDIEGMNDFAGTVVHTARWHRDVEPAGRRVAVIGTGASGVQVIPEIAETASHLDVFQRTPAWMLPKADVPYTDAEVERFRRVPWATRLARWRIFKQQHDNTVVRTDDPRTAERQMMAHGYLHHKVADPQLRDALTPAYPFGCKRVLLGGRYYAALQREHVDLHTDGITRITPSGVVTADGHETEVDMIVLATGFEATSYLSGIEVIGSGGRRLHDEWSGGAQAYLGVAVAGFPNFFMIYGPNTNQGGNSVVYILEAGARLVRAAVARIARRGGVLEVRAHAQDAFNEALQSDLADTVWTQCASYFRASDGRIVTQWPHTGWDYARRTRRLRRSDWQHTRPRRRSADAARSSTLEEIT